MKLKILSLFVFSFFVLSFAPVVFAENVEVVGRVDNSNTTTTGSKVIFKDVTSQQIISTTTVDPAGTYSISVPQGKYDITVLPSAQSGLKPVTKSNQTITSNSVSTFSLPSTTNPIAQRFSQNTLEILIAGTVLLLLVIVGLVVWIKHK